MLGRLPARLVACALVLLPAPGFGADGDAPPSDGGAWAAARAEGRQVVAELRSEVQAMNRILAAQKELTAWNEERAKVGLTARTLRSGLCLEEELERWCRLLPSTFGAAEDRR